MTRTLRIACLAIGMFIAPFTVRAEPETVRLAYQTGDINTLTMYAEAAHLFEKAGIAVKMVAFPAGPAILPAIAAGEVDVGWMGEFPIVTGYANGIPLEMIMIDRINKTNVRLVARPGTGIDSLKDLKGKKIAVSIGSTSHQHIVRALKMVGLKQEDVTLVNLSPAAMPAAYLAGQVDAAFTWEPNITLMQSGGGKVIATTESIGDITGVFLAARAAFVKEHPDAVQRFLAAWEQATADHAKSEADVRQYEAKRLGLTVPDFSAMLGRMTATYPGYKEQLDPIYLGPPGQELQSKMMSHLQEIGAFLIDEKRIASLPKDWSKIIDSKPIADFVASKKSN